MTEQGKSQFLFVSLDNWEFSLQDLERGRWWIKDQSCQKISFFSFFLGFAFILWKFLYLNDKTVMRVVQYGMGVFFGAQLSIDAIQLLEEGLSILLETMVRVFLNSHNQA